MAMERGATAHTTWLTLENQFLGNRETCALHLDAQFRHFVQGDLPVSDYCRRFKTMADALGDLGEPVSDRTLVLNVLRGLSDRFSDIGRHLHLGRPFPTFHDVRATLLLEELTMAHRASSPSAALLTSTKPPQGGASTTSNKAPAASNKAPSAPRHPNRRSKRGGHGRQGILRFPGTSPGGQHGGASGLWPSIQNPWTGAIQMWPGPRTPTPQQQQGLLAQHQALLPPTAQQQQAFYAAPVSIAPHQALLAHQTQQYVHGALQGQGDAPLQHTLQTDPLQGSAPQSPYGMLAQSATPSWDAQSLASAFSTVSLTLPQQTDWYFDTGATSHMTSNAGTLSNTSTPSLTAPSSIIFGDGSLLHVISTGSTTLHGSLHLNNVLVSPKLIKNLISVRQFTTDNNCSIEFDPSCCSVKDLLSRNVIVRCNSSGPLYPLCLPAAHSFIASSTLSLWHRRLGHPGHESLSKLASIVPMCNKDASSPLCHACQLSRHVRLSFRTSTSRAVNNFDLIHCDLWTSPILSVSGFKYYLVVLDDCSHYLWTFPLRLKSDAFPTLTQFFAYVKTQFGVTIKAVQCDNGREFDNSNSRTFFLTHGVLLHMSCPYTSSQNGKAERIIRTTNNTIRSLLFQASIPPTFWVEALHTATLLLNILPTKTLHFSTPHFALFKTVPSYEHLRVFGCTCYPNLSATTSHKLDPHSAKCVFLGYLSHHKGYRCLDLLSNRVILSRHVVFDESTFPFAEQQPTASSQDFDFLDTITTNTVPPPIGPPPLFLSGLRAPRGGVNR
jgi:hypothetical protein